MSNDNLSLLFDLILTFVIIWKDENPSDIDEGAYENDNRDTEVSGANLELGDGDKEGDANATSDATKAKIIKPKRNIAKQPLLNADRILGKRGIRVLEKMFEDFEPRGTMLIIFLTIYM